jgi:alginate O-acetyltransferase complex protein AlgI
MNEQILYLNAGIFIALCMSLLSSKKYQIDVFTIISIVFLFFISKVTAVALIAFSSSIFLLSYMFVHGAKKIFIYIGILACVIVFVITQTLHHQNNAIVFIGVIYIVCRQIHYLVEVLKANNLPCNYYQYLRYQCFLPCLIAGPIHRVDDFEKAIRRRKVEFINISNGMERVVWGHFKIIFITNTLIKFIEINYLNADFLGSINPIINSFVDWLKLYLIFSGFSDIAIGFALVLGIKLKENFIFPFLSLNINEFWQRWHISLSTWCKDYVFTPTLAMTRSFLIATIVSMIIIGLWHEFSIRYVLWGIYHGLGLMFFQWYKSQKWNFNMPSSLAIILTLLFVISSYPVTAMISNYLYTLIEGL